MEEKLMTNTVPVSHCVECEMKHCPTCYTKECQCDNCLIFATWLNMGNNKSSLNQVLRPFDKDARAWVAQRTWIDREVWLLHDSKQAYEEGCDSNPWYAALWAERERVGKALLDKLCGKETGCKDPKCLFIIQILTEVIG
jgi:hypothetical protein